MNEFSKSKHPFGSVRHVLLFSLPVIISQACDGLMMLTDRYLISLFDPLGPPAALAGAMSTFTLWIFFIGLLGYITPLVSRLAGSGEHERKEQVLSQGFILGTISSGFLVLVGPWLALKNFTLLGVPEEVVALAMRYLNVLIAGTFIVLARAPLAAYFSGIGKTKTVMWVSIIGIIVNVPLSYLAIRGDFGSQWAGIKGAAFATVLSEGLMVLVYLFAYSQVRGFHLKDWRLNRSLLGSLLRFGSSTGAEFLVLTLATNTFLAAFQSYGIQASQAITIAISWSWLLVLPFLGLNIGLMSLIGFALGEKNSNLAKSTVMSGLKITVTTTAFSALVFWGAPEWLAMVFQNESGPLNALAVGMIIALPALTLCDAISFVLTAALRAGGDTRFCFLMSLCVQWSVVSLCSLGIYRFGWSPLVIWWLFIGALAVQSSLHATRYLGGRWLVIRVTEENHK